MGSPARRDQEGSCQRNAAAAKELQAAQHDTRTYDSGSPGLSFTVCQGQSSQCTHTHTHTALRGCVITSAKVMRQLPVVAHADMMVFYIRFYSMLHDIRFYYVPLYSITSYCVMHYFIVDVGIVGMHPRAGVPAVCVCSRVFFSSSCWSCCCSSEQPRGRLRLKVETRGRLALNNNPLVI